MNRKIKVGRFLFKHRSFTPIPLIVLALLLFSPVDLGADNIFVYAGGLALSLLGETVRVLAVGFSSPGTSGREKYLRAEDLNVTGIYSIVRNPLYIGNVLIFSGLLVVFANTWALLVFDLFLVLQYYFVILAEENYLHRTYGPHYETYCREVHRILPRFKNYREPAHPFNSRKVIFKENDSLFNLLLMFLLILAYKEKFFTGTIRDLHLYLIPGVILVTLYSLVKILKKR